MPQMPVVRADTLNRVYAETPNTIGFPCYDKRK
jgi:hypothetical protein